MGGVHIDKIDRDLSGDVAGRDIIKNYGLEQKLEVLLSLHVEITAYRQAVIEKLQAEQIQFRISDKEYSDSEIELHKDLLWATGGFLGILGSWYGHILPDPDLEMSRCHLELYWACDYWLARGEQRLFILVPDKKGQAFQDLDSQTRQIQPGDKYAFSKKKIETVYQELKHLIQTKTRDPFRHWREYTTQDYLAKVAGVTCRSWKNPLLKTATTPPPAKTSPSPGIDTVDLGKLGRQRQLKRVNDIVATLEWSDEADRPPALAFLVYGLSEMGHTEFLHYLFDQSYLNTLLPRPNLRAKPSTKNISTEQVVQWMADRLGLDERETITTPETLAEPVYDRLAEQPLCFVLDAVSERVAGGLVTFQQQVWQPFYTALNSLHQTAPARHRLTALLVDYTTGQAPPPTSACLATLAVDALDFGKLLALPELTKFQKGEYMSWFTEMKIPNKKNRWKSLYDDVHRRSPEAVFNYLRQENLWGEGE